MSKSFSSALKSSSYGAVALVAALSLQPQAAQAGEAALNGLVFGYEIQAEAPVSVQSRKPTGAEILAGFYGADDVVVEARPASARR